MVAANLKFVLVAIFSVVLLQCISEGQAQATISVTVSIPDDTSMSIRTNQRIADLRSTYAQVKNIPVGNVRLTFNGRVLNDNDTPASAGIGNGAVIQARRV